MRSPRPGRTYRYVTSSSLVLMLRCRQCDGRGPLPRLIGLSRFPPVTTMARNLG